MGDPTGDGFLQLLSVMGMNTTIGNASNNTLQGTNSNDALYGMGGNDNLYGNAGNDILDGGTGDDYLVGGTGNDSTSSIGTGRRHLYDDSTQANGHYQIRLRVASDSPHPQRQPILGAKHSTNYHTRLGCDDYRMSVEFAEEQ